MVLRVLSFCTFHTAVNDWASAVTRLQEGLSGLKRETSDIHFDIRLDANDFKSFQAALDDICIKFARRDTSRLIRDKITPHLLHVRSFEKAIAAGAQNDQIASLIWGVSQAVIEYACRFSNHLDKTFDQLSDVYKSFPLFEAYMEFLPEEPALKYPLRNLYSDYSQFCILTIKYMSKSPLTQMVKNIVQSGPQRKLKSIQANVETHKKDFEKALDLVMRRRAIAGESSRSPQTRSDRESGLPGMSPHHLRSSSKDQGRMSMAFSTNRTRENRAFIGREALLKQLHDWFTEPRSYPIEPVSCVLYGKGGIGQSQTAIKYSYVDKDEYDFIFWVTAETIPKLVGSFSLIASKIGIDGTDSSHTVADSTVEKSREWLEESSKLNNIGLESLDAHQEAKLLLMARYRDTEPLESEEVAAAELSTEVRGLPLAVTYIGGYVTQFLYTMARFREIAKQRYPQIWMAEAPSTIRDYQKRLAIVWDFALEQLSPDAVTLIGILAFLNPDEIPEAILLAELKEGSTWKLKTTSAEIFLMDMAHSLAQRSLVSVEQRKSGSYLTIHRSLQTGLLQKLDKNPYRRSIVFTNAINIDCRMTPSVSPIQAPTPKY